MVMWSCKKIEVPTVSSIATEADVVVLLIDKDTGILHGRTETVDFAAGKMDVDDLMEKLDANFAPNDFGVV